MMPDEILTNDGPSVEAYNRLLTASMVLSDAAAALEQSCETAAASSWVPVSGAIGGLFSAARQAEAGCAAVVEGMDLHLERCVVALDELQPFTERGGPASAELIDKAHRLADACYRIAGATEDVARMVADAQPAEAIAAAAKETAAEVAKVAAVGGVAAGVGALLFAGLYLLIALK